MDLKLTDQVAVIVGAERGIGRAIAESFAAEGCRVGLIDRGPEIEAAAEVIAETFDGKVCAAIADVADEEAVRKAAVALHEQLGRVDHVVFTAAVGSGKFGFPFWNLEPFDWPRVLEVNLLGAVHTAHAFSPYLVEQQGGTLLFFVSVAAQIGSPTDPPYSASKAGVLNFMQCAARDLAPHGVRVNAISPGMVKTALNESVWASSQKGLPDGKKQDYETWAAEKIAAISPLGRWQEPDEFGAMAVYLASHHARGITGQTINIDGGQVMHS